MMRRQILSILMLASGAAMLPTQAEAAYKLNLSSGRLPKDVTTENANGVLPRKSAYKRGYVENGWTVDRFGMLGYAALSPTYTAGEASCENVLTLPAVSVTEEDHYLRWDAQSVYRHFPESYRVEAIASADGEPVVLQEIGEESFSMQSYQISLEDYIGQDLTIRFVCTSSKGYMLLLANVEVGAYDEDAEPQPDFSGDDMNPFTRRMLVDRGTGMWCVNCPAGEVAVDDLRNTFGKRLVTLNTHVNDALGNQPYWDELKWYAVPYMMLNRIKASAGENTKNFSQYYDDPTSFAVSLDEIGAPEGRTLSVTARVAVAEDIDNSTDRYRVGYVVTGEFYEPENADFVQQNNCNQPYYGAFYYLPSLITPDLMHYDDVTLTSATAFSGIEGSLPASMQPGNSYEVSWQVEVPELLADASAARVVAFVLDTTTGEAENCDALRVGQKPTVGMEPTLAAAQQVSLEALRGGIGVNVPAGEAYRVELYDIAGGLAASYSGTGSGSQEAIKIEAAPGIYLVSLAAPSGRATLKLIIP